ncbi:hypothetical protein J437_LFUL018290 [Ladona fulva]|uniref:Uncharacterized protein n=1 Tax=Ladona fulva TaxID=123851 RepID=A0A8K0KR51_LADFU|nr:hypothetical protein J437_LFUL018290 [Ladona fulva]
MCGAEEGSGRLGSSSAVLSRLAVLFGLLSMATLMAALLGSSWIFTVEPVRLPPATQRTDAVSATVTFRIGLWKVCPSLRKHNASHDTCISQTY